MLKAYTRDGETNNYYTLLGYEVKETLSDTKTVCDN